MTTTHAATSAAFARALSFFMPPLLQPFGPSPTPSLSGDCLREIGPVPSPFVRRILGRYAYGCQLDVGSERCSLASTPKMSSLIRADQRPRQGSAEPSEGKTFQ